MYIYMLAWMYTTRMYSCINRCTYICLSVDTFLCISVYVCI